MGPTVPTATVMDEKHLFHSGAPNFEPCGMRPFFSNQIWCSLGKMRFPQPKTTAESVGYKQKTWLCIDIAGVVSYLFWGILWSQSKKQQNITNPYASGLTSNYSNYVVVSNAAFLCSSNLTNIFQMDWNHHLVKKSPFWKDWNSKTIHLNRWF